MNFIPVRRRVAKQRRRHVRRCVSICITCGVASALACVAALAFSPGDDATVETRLDRAARDLENAGRAADKAALELHGAEGTLRATRAIADQPDWSVLLALLAKTGGPEVVLRGYDVTPIEPAILPAPVQPAVKEPAAKSTHHLPKPPSKAPEPAKSLYLLTLQGVGKSQFATTQFVLRLEQSGLFDSVRLLDTTRQSVNNIEAVGFRVECTFGNGPPAGTASASIGGAI